MKKIVYCILLGCIFLNFNCIPSLTTGINRELTMRGETERELALWLREIRQNPRKYKQEDRDFVKEIYNIHREKSSFPWERIYRRYNNNNRSASTSQPDPTISITPAPYKKFTKDDDYWRWSDQPQWFYFKEDVAGEYEMSRDTVLFLITAPDEKEKTLKDWGLMIK